MDDLGPTLHRYYHYDDGPYWATLDPGAYTADVREWWNGKWTYSHETRDITRDQREIGQRELAYGRFLDGMRY